ncbi:MAG: hypothetical protein U9Q30_08990 [Campylobacterota bacterium]|nr:hypothetical protein [Campylobacterota bacterium]
MFDFPIDIDIELPKITKYHYEIKVEVDEKNDYEFWSDNELEYISKVDLSTPLEDDEDYSKW